MELCINLLISQPYTIVIKPINILLIYTSYNMPPQDKGEESTRRLNRKAVKEAVGSDLVKTFTN